MQGSLNKRLIFRILENMPLPIRLACVLLAILGNILVDSRFYSLTEGETYEYYGASNTAAEWKGHYHDFNGGRKKGDRRIPRGTP